MQDAIAKFRLKQIHTSQVIHFPNLPAIIGRKAILHEIAGGFEKTPIVVLYGEGGIGKTAIAVEYCRQQHQQRSTGSILWINCEVAPSYADCLSLVYQQIYGSLGSDQKEIVSKIEGYCQDNPPLLILDSFAICR